MLIVWQRVKDETMKTLMKYLKERLKKCDRLYVCYREIMFLRRDRKTLLAQAVGKFEKEKPQHGNLKDYKRALCRHRVFYDEYMYAFEFWRMNEKQRSDFISDREMMCIYRKTVTKDVFHKLKNKVSTLQLFSKYVHRNYIYVPNTPFDTFKNFVNSNDCIAKPLLGMKGNGVFKIEKNKNVNLGELYSYCFKNNMLVEECVQSCKEIEEFHPQSLNTIRVVTVSNKGKCELLGAMLRMGIKNKVVDNSSAGGVVAPININTGEIVTSGIDKEGNRYEKHPDSGKMIKGFVIPYWDSIVKLCKVLPTSLPDLVFAGWDIAVLPNGELELIEANVAPLVSGGLQSPMKVGLKPRLSTLGKAVLGYDPVKLISIWSKSHVKYEGVYGRY